MKYTFTDGKAYSNNPEEIIEDASIEFGHLGIITGAHYIGTVKNMFMFIAKYPAATHFIITEEEEVIDSLMVLYPASQLQKVKP